MQFTAYKFSLTALCVLYAFAYVPNTWAETQSFGEITVTSPKEEKPPEEDSRIDNTTNTVWDVDAQDIQREMQGGSDLKGALGRLIPSMDFSSETSRSNTAQGMRGRPVLVLIDGVSLNSTRGISRQFDSINAFNIERVEVVSGASSIYGPSARGGVINIITKKGDSYGFGGEFSVGLSSNLRDSESLSKKYAVGVHQGSDIYQLRASIAGEQLGGAYDADNEQINLDSLQTDTQFNQSTDAMISALYRPTPNQAITAMYQRYDSEQDSSYGNYFDFGKALQQNPLPGRTVYPQKGLELEYPPRTQRNLFNFKYNHNNFFTHKLNAQVYYRNESFRFFPFPTEQELLEYEYEKTRSLLFGSSEQNSEIYGANISLQKQWDKLNLHYGIDTNRDEFFAKQRFYNSVLATQSHGLKYKLTQVLQKYPQTVSHQTGIFLQSKYNLNDVFTLTAGLRTQYIKHRLGPHRNLLSRYKIAENPNLSINDVAQTEEIEESTHVTLLNAGVNYKINPHSQTWFNFSQGLDLVPPARLKIEITTSDKNKALQREILKNNPVVDSFELGYRFNNNQWMAQVSPYYSTSDKTYKLGQDFKIDIKEWQRHIFGVEGQVKRYFANDYSAGIQFHYNKSKMETDKGDTGLYVYQATPNTFRFMLGKDTGNWGVNLSYNRLFSYNDDPEKEKDSNYNRDILPDPKIEGYHTVNLDGYYAIQDGEYGRIKFGIDNLLNEKYETIWSAKAQDIYSPIIYTFPNLLPLFQFNGPGRTYALSYEYEF